MKNNIISILLPTRKRKTSLEASIKSLVENAALSTRLELIIGIDEDDAETVDWLKTTGADYFKEKNIECRASIFKKLGFGSIHAYNNSLASNANGQWLFLWQDDALMQTKDWDLVVDQYNNQFKLLAPNDNHNGNPNAIFPIIPRDWYTLLEHVSVHPHTDAWLSHIAYMLDIFERVEINVVHDRADITGNNNDETYRSRISYEGDPDTVGDFGHADMLQTRVRSAYRLAWFLDRIGQKSEWWEKVQKGEQDPFEKFKASTGKNAIGMGPVASKPTESKKLPDNTKIQL